MNASFFRNFALSLAPSQIGSQLFHPISPAGFIFLIDNKIPINHVSLGMICADVITTNPLLLFDDDFLEKYIAENLSEIIVWGKLQLSCINSFRPAAGAFPYIDEKERVWGESIFPHLLGDGNLTYYHFDNLDRIGIAYDL